MKHRRIWMWAPLAVVLCMALTLSLSGRAAEVIKLDQKCSLTVVPGPFKGDEGAYLTEQLANAAVVLDLYKVGSAVPNSSNGLTYDGYEYELEPWYKGEDGLQLTGNMTNADWREQARKAAEIALGVSVDPATGAVIGRVWAAPVKSDQSPNQKIEDLDAGLYLLIARRGGTGDPDVTYKDVAKYTVVNRDSDGTETIATIANAPDCVFTFEPELISLPGKEPYTDASGNQVSSSENPGPWLYDMEAVLKAQADTRRGSLQITKVVPEFGTIAGDNVQRPVTFIFEVSAVWTDPVSGEQKEYKDVVSINFTGAGSHTAYEPGEELELPVGAVVTVKEIYSGSGYQPYPVDGTDGNAGREAYEQTVTISEAGQVFGVTFTNYYNGRHVDGHGIANNFTYSTDQNRWIWTSVHADGTVGGEITQNGNTTESGNTPEGEQASGDATG